MYHNLFLILLVILLSKNALSLDIYPNSIITEATLPEMNNYFNFNLLNETVYNIDIEVMSPSTQISCLKKAVLNTIMESSIFQNNSSFTVKHIALVGFNAYILIEPNILLILDLSVNATNNSEKIQLTQNVTDFNFKSNNRENFLIGINKDKILKILVNSDATVNETIIDIPLSFALPKIIDFIFVKNAIFVATGESGLVIFELDINYTSIQTKTVLKLNISKMGIMLTKENTIFVAYDRNMRTFYFYKYTSLNQMTKWGSLFQILFVDSFRIVNNLFIMKLIKEDGTYNLSFFNISETDHDINVIESFSSEAKLIYSQEFKSSFTIIHATEEFTLLKESSGNYILYKHELLVHGGNAIEILDISNYNQILLQENTSYLPNLFVVNNTHFSLIQIDYPYIQCLINKNAANNKLDPKLIIRSLVWDDKLNTEKKDFTYSLITMKQENDQNNENLRILSSDSPLSSLNIAGNEKNITSDSNEINQIQIRDIDNNFRKQTNLSQISGFNDDIMHENDQKDQIRKGIDVIFSMNTIIFILLGFVLFILFMVCCIKLNSRQDDENTMKFIRNRQYQMQIIGKYKDESPQIHFADDDDDKNLERTLVDTSFKKHTIKNGIQNIEREMITLNTSLEFDDIKIDDIESLKNLQRYN